MSEEFTIGSTSLDDLPEPKGYPVEMGEVGSPQPKRAPKEVRDYPKIVEVQEPVAREARPQKEPEPQTVKKAATEASGSKRWISSDRGLLFAVPEEGEEAVWWPTIALFALALVAILLAVGLIWSGFVLNRVANVEGLNLKEAMTLQGKYASGVVGGFAAPPTPFQPPESKAPSLPTSHTMLPSSSVVAPRETTSRAPKPDAVGKMYRR